ncbi:Histidine--tRNA ligase [Holothuria leucospilota]|uniref:Histidine--tRNA ligase n=1 Tax=Holothuria leucospilota TaxID=206669 RepID=A0A9Q1CUH5_HOLLE|nr:Histidine--tRNA ligase [Holothuria leucospilota]
MKQNLQLNFCRLRVVFLWNLKLISQSMLFCALHEVRPNISLSWMKRTSSGDRFITSGKFITPGRVWYTSHITTFMTLDHSPSLQLLVCKVEGPSGLLERDESLILLQRSNGSFQAVQPTQRLVELHKRLELSCAETDTMLIIWKRYQKANKEKELLLWYGVSRGEHVSKVVDEDYTFGVSGNLEIKQLEVQHEGLYICFFGDGLSDGVIKYQVDVYDSRQEAQTESSCIEVPFALYIIKNKITSMTRYQIASVFRKDIEEAGRYRELYQCITYVPAPAEDSLYRGSTSRVGQWIASSRKELVRRPNQVSGSGKKTLQEGIYPHTIAQQPFKKPRWEESPDFAQRKQGFRPQVGVLNSFQKSFCRFQTKHFWLPILLHKALRGEGSTNLLSDNWHSITNGSWVLSVIDKGYVLEFLKQPPKFTRVVRPPLPKKNGERRALLLEVTVLLRKGAIRPVPQGKRSKGFKSTHFMVPKASGDYRPILNLKPLNRLLQERHSLPVNRENKQNDQPVVDLFATKLKKQPPVYVSPTAEEGVLGVDTLPVMERDVCVCVFSLRDTPKGSSEDKNRKVLDNSSSSILAQAELDGNHIATPRDTVSRWITALTRWAYENSVEGDLKTYKIRAHDRAGGCGGVTPPVFGRPSANFRPVSKKSRGKEKEEEKRKRGEEEKKREEGKKEKDREGKGRRRMKRKKEEERTGQSVIGHFDCRIFI